MNITTEIDFELDIANEVLAIAEEAMEENHCGYQTEEDVISLIECGVEDFVDHASICEMINEAVLHINYSTDVINDLKDMTEDQRADLAVGIELIDRQRLAINRLTLAVGALEDRMLRNRLRRAWAAARRFVASIHWYSPSIGPRR